MKAGELEGREMGAVREGAEYGNRRLKMIKVKTSMKCNEIQYFVQLYECQ